MEKESYLLRKLLENVHRNMQVEFIWRKKIMNNFLFR